MNRVESHDKCATEPGSTLETLYSTALPSTRSGYLYGAFSYPTKISPEAIALFVAAHTEPGDTVFDGFAGSGTTGLAALLCENPPERLRAEAKRLGLDVNWGARNAVIYELGALGAFVGQILSNPPSPRLFQEAGESILQAAEGEDGWTYEATDLDGRKGTIRYVIWSDQLICPECNQSASLWDSCVSLHPAEIASSFCCQVCGNTARIEDTERVLVSSRDEFIGQERTLRHRKPVRVYGSTGKNLWSRDANAQDLSVIARVHGQPIPRSVPRVEVPWGDLYRSGYHQGITHLHHFYSRRNLYVFARLWERANNCNGALAEALRFWLLSYNASHSTIMTRVVAKSEQKDLVVTSAQPGVLYVSGLPVEKNLLVGLRRKLLVVARAFGIIHGGKGRVSVHQRSSCNVHLTDKSVDYVFTDPPFGGNIPYSEINFLNEAWLGRYTDRCEEAIVSHNQEKSINDYQVLLKRSLSEAHRILKPNGKVTLVFHSASAQVWNALRAAYQEAGFGVEYAGVLNKLQGSFKQVTTEGAVKGDPVLLLGKIGATEPWAESSVWTVAEQLRREALLSIDPVEQTAPRLYSRLVNYFLSRNQPVPLSADAFYKWHKGLQAIEVGIGAKS